MAKTLIFVPEAHSNSRKAHAVGLARQLQARGFNVKLFLEGTPKGDVERVSQREGFPVCETEAGELDPIGQLTLLHALAYLNAFVVARNKLGDASAEQLVAGFIERYGGGAERDPDLAEFTATSRFSDVEAHHTFVLAKAAGLQLPTEEFVRVLGVVLASEETAMVAPLRGLIDLVLGNMGALETGISQRVATATGRAMEFLRAERGIALTLEEGALETIDMQRLAQAAAAMDPLVFSETMAPMMEAFSMYREIYLAYCIAKEEFGVGILNIGENHYRNPAFHRLLRASGIEGIRAV